MLYSQILQFYKRLSPDFPMPDGVTVMHPYQEKQVWKVVDKFYRKYYVAGDSRILIFGINPGRFGAGVTGVPFTDPIRLETECGIVNPFEKRFELSSQFIYDVIRGWGGTESFYKHFFISSLSPLGFVRQGKNMNYYDDKALQLAVTPFIVDCITRQKQLLRSPELAFCLGEGTNYKFFYRLNEQFHLFGEIVPLPHPRWVMQYRRKRKEEFIHLYIDKLKTALD